MFGSCSEVCKHVKRPCVKVLWDGLVVSSDSAECLEKAHVLGALSLGFKYCSLLHQHTTFICLEGGSLARHLFLCLLEL
jgi:hypothetical protein